MKLTKTKITIGILLAFAILLVGLQTPYGKALVEPWYSYVASNFNFNPQGSALVAQEFSYTYVSTNNSTTSVKTAAGLLHSLTINTPAASSVITLYDDASTSVVSAASTAATGTITFGGGASSSTIATGTFFATINGFTIQTPSVTSSASSTAVATVMTTAINNASTTIGATATSTNNVVTITNSTAGVAMTLFAMTPQWGLTVTSSLGTFTTQTPVIAKITLPATLLNQGPMNAIYDVYFANGLLVTQTGNTSTLTISAY